VSALDESTREQVCMELRTLHDALGMTTIHVSHNFEETRALADIVGVVNAGRLVQIGTVDDIFRRPANEFVARFVRAGNILRRGPHGLPRSGDSAYLLRPHDVRVLAENAQPADGHIVMRGRIVSVHENGLLQITARVNVETGETISAIMTRPADAPLTYRLGQEVRVSFDPNRLHALSTT